MKNKITLLLVLFVGMQINAQVGINTTEPHATLDVNGTMRLQTRTMANTNAKKLLGVDEDGMIVELEMDDNLYIEDNKVKYSGRKEGINNVELSIADVIIDNLASIVWPGAAGDGKGITRLNSSVANDIELTGIDISNFATPMDAHGITVYLYSVSGDLTLKSESTSALENQFILGDGNDVNLKKYEMVKLMYDGILQKWIVMSKH